MTFSLSNPRHGFPRSHRQWAVRFRSLLVEALACGAANDALAESGALELRAELSQLAGQRVEWIDPAVVERLVRAAAHAEAFSMRQPTLVGEDSDVGANLATSMFKLYLRENRGVDCSSYFSTFPARIARAAEQLDSIPEEASNELSFCASMAVAALR